MRSYESGQEVSGAHIRADMNAPLSAAITLGNLQRYGHVRLTALGSAISKAVDIAAIAIRLNKNIRYEVKFGTVILRQNWISTMADPHSERYISRIIIDLTSASK
jgi:DNA-binding protein